MPVNINDANFEQEVVKSDIPVLLDFWAPWCGPCKMIAPVLDEIAETYRGKVKVCKINIDENQQTPTNFGVRSIPTLMLFVAGQPKDVRVGAVSKVDLTAFLDNNI